MAINETYELTDHDKEQIIKELDLLREMFPEDFVGRINRVIKAMKDGRITGTEYVQRCCGCFYGHFIGLENSEDNIYETCKDVRQDIHREDLCTPIEIQIIHIQGEVLKDSPDLQALYDIILEYIPKHFPSWVEE